MNKRATIEDVARIAGVSTATVSRAIHTPKVVSDSTRKAVLGAIDRTGYTLNQAARNLRQQRANAVLVLVPDIGNTFFSEILAGIERVASAAGQTILIGHTAHDQSREEKFLSALNNGQADGVLLLNGHLPPSALKRTQINGERPAPIISVSEALDPQVVSHVGIDNTKAAAVATQYLIDRGHKHIAHLRGPLGNILTQQRIAGYAQAMKAANLNVTESCILDGDFTIESGIEAARHLARNEVMPTAVFCSNDEMAIGLMSELAEQGIQVPSDLSVVGFDDIAFARTSIPGLTTIRQPRAKIGECAMERLLKLINGEDTGLPSAEILETQIIERSSVRAR